MAEALARLKETVTPAKAGVQKSLQDLDSCFRWNDVEGLFQEARPTGTFQAGAGKQQG
jgi:hypothetical protein